MEEYQLCIFFIFRYHRHIIYFEKHNVTMKEEHSFIVYFILLIILKHLLLEEFEFKLDLAVIFFIEYFFYSYVNYVIFAIY